METVFSRATEAPCPVCIEMVNSGYLEWSSVMPLPVVGPRSVDGRPCCFDCQAAEVLMRLSSVTFDMARHAVAAERAETLRMPDGLSQAIGLCSMGVMRPASIDWLDFYYDWLERVFPNWRE